MSGHSERGYALLLAIAVIATLAFILASVAQIQAQTTATVARAQSEEEQTLAAETLAARTVFALLSSPTDPASALMGGAELRLDGRPYRARTDIGPVIVMVQDEAGLLNLNAGDEAAVSNLLTELEVAPAEATRMAGALADYVDEDDAVRLQGAEGAAYAAQGLPGPINRVLLVRWQALSVLGWRTRLDGPRRGVFWSLTATMPPQTALNVNTAPPAVLAAVLGDERAAEALLDRREAAPILDLAEVEALTGPNVRAAGVRLAAFPGRSFRLCFVFEGVGGLRSLERRIMLTDSDPERPFRVVYEQAGGDFGWRGRYREQDLQPFPLVPSAS